MGELLLRVATCLSYELDGVGMEERKCFRTALPLARLLLPHDPQFALEFATLALVAYHGDAEIKAAEVLCHSLLSGMRPTAAIDKATEAKFYATFMPVKRVHGDTRCLEP